MVASGLFAVNFSFALPIRWVENASSPLVVPAHVEENFEGSGRSTLLLDHVGQEERDF